MNPGTPPLQATPLRTTRLVLEPLRVDHADAMVEVLGDHSLYDVTGGGPPTLDELVATYTRQTAGHSADGTETWLNWVAVEALSGQPVGYVQATMTRGDSGEFVADIAWVVGVAWQGLGLATEAAQAMLDFLVDSGVGSISAFIEPGHRASERVAQRLGMVQTTDSADGEIRWEAVTRRN